VPKIVEAARDLRGLACAFPSDFPAVHRLRWNNFVGALSAVVPCEAILLVREYVVFGLCAEEKTPPVRQHGYCAGI